MTRDQQTEHPSGALYYLNLEKKGEGKPMARCIFARFNFTPTPSLPKRGDLRTIEPIRVGDRRTLGWEEARQGVQVPIPSVNAPRHLPFYF